MRAETLTDGEQRFSLLETLREFALEQLQMQGEAEAVRRHHYEIYLHRFRISFYTVARTLDEFETVNQRGLTQDEFATGDL